MIKLPNAEIIFQVTERHMQITQEEKVHVAVTKKEEPPRARGTWSFSIHRILYFPYSLYQIRWLWVLVIVVRIGDVLCLK